MSQSRGLEAEVGMLIVRVACRAGQRRLQAGDVTELVAGLGIGAPEDFGVQTDDVFGLEVYGLLLRVGQALTSAVVRLEDTKRFAIFSDQVPAKSPHPRTDSVGLSDEEPSGRKLLHQNFAVGAVSEVLNPVRERHDVAVADSPDLHDLHCAQYTRVYTACQAYTMPDNWGLFEGDGWGARIRTWEMADPK